jgi:hypothetical protein
MDWKKELLASTEVWTGVGLILVGLAARGLGASDLFAVALTPFGIGLILSDVAAKLAKAAREKAKIRVSRKNDRDFEDRDRS